MTPDERTFMREVKDVLDAALEELLVRVQRLQEARDGHRGMRRVRRKGHWVARYYVVIGPRKGHH